MLSSPLMVSEPVATLILEEREKLQGAWVFDNGDKKAQLLIAGNHFAVKLGRSRIYMGTFDIDPTTQPRAMDMLVEQGPVQHSGKIALCIYELEGDRLRFCAAEPGDEDRLTAFPDSEALKKFEGLCATFVRE